MQLYRVNANSKNKFKVIFNEIETNNIKQSLGDRNISVRNLFLCYYIEKRLPEIFKECSNKRVMVLNIENDERYITALVLLQNMSLGFNKPKERNGLLKVTQVTFKDNNMFKNWLINTNYAYRITDIKAKKVIIFNMSKYDEIAVSEFGARINRVCSITKYILLETAEKFEKCFS